MPMIKTSVQDFFLKALLTTVVVLSGASLQVAAQVSNRSPIDLSRRLAEFQTERSSWASALGLLLDKTDIPYLLELETLTYQDMSVRYKLGLFTGSEEERTERGRQWHTRFKVDLKDVTIEEALKRILKDQPRYTYEIAMDGRCLHIFPRGIQERKDWTLNQPVAKFTVDEQQINRKWYRGVFGPFLLKYQVHIGEFDSSDFSRRLVPRKFDNITLRELLMQLSAMCQMQWMVEPFPEEEIKAREIIDKKRFERGYDIGRPGSNGWYQIHFSFLGETPK